MSGVVDAVPRAAMAAGVLQQTGRTSAFSKPTCGGETDTKRTNSDSDTGMSDHDVSRKGSPSVSPALNVKSALPTRKPFSTFSVDSLIGGDSSRTRHMDISRPRPSSRSSSDSPSPADRSTDSIAVSPSPSQHKHSPFTVDGLLGKTPDPTTTAHPTTGLFTHPYLQARAEASKWQAAEITFSPWLSNPTFTPPPREYETLLPPKRETRRTCSDCALKCVVILVVYQADSTDNISVT